MTKTDPTEFRAKALSHYQLKLAAEMMRFGVKAVSDEYVEHNSHVLTSSDMWDDLAKQLKLKIVVECYDDPQTVYVIVSESEIPRPGELYSLWHVISGLVVETDQKESERLSEDIETLDCYEGPYKMDVPSDLFSVKMKIDCPTCGPATVEVPDSVPYCPKCGKPITPENVKG